MSIWKKQESKEKQNQSLAYYLPDFIEDEIEEGKGSEEALRGKMNNVRQGMENSNHLSSYNGLINPPPGLPMHNTLIGNRYQRQATESQQHQLMSSHPGSFILNAQDIKMCA